MINDIFTYEELCEKIDNESIEIKIGQILEMNGIIFPTLNKVVIYKKKIEAFACTYIIIMDFLMNNNVIARKIINKNEMLEIKNSMVKYIINVKTKDN